MNEQEKIALFKKNLGESFLPFLNAKVIPGYSQEVSESASKPESSKYKKDIFRLEYILLVKRFTEAILRRKFGIYSETPWFVDAFIQSEWGETPPVGFVVASLPVVAAQVVAEKIKLEPYPNLTFGQLTKDCSEELELLDYCRNKPLPPEISPEFDPDFRVILENRERLNGLAIFKVHEAETSHNLNLIKEWEEIVEKQKEFIETKTAEIAALEQRLEKSRSELNFTILNKGFKTFSEAKTKDTTSVLGTPFKFLVAAMIAIPVLGFLHHFWSTKAITTSDKILELTPYLGLELLLIFFFRIILKDYFSSKAQLLQIHNRMAAVAFIEDYVRFKKDNELLQGHNHLEKFESLIFGGIAAEESKVPTHFDGIEDLANLLGKFKK